MTGWDARRLRFMGTVLRLPSTALVGLLLLSGSALAAAEVAKSADAFVDSIGVNIHAARPVGNAYDNWTAVESALGDLGIRYVRDMPWETARLNDLTATTGAKIFAIMQHLEGPTSIDAQYVPEVVAQAKALIGLAAMEGTNEPNEIPNWTVPLPIYQSTLYQAVKSDPVLSSKPLLAPSLDSPYTYPSMAGVLNPYLDAGNVHLYATTGGSPLTGHPTLAVWLAAAPQISDAKPVYITEAGYHTGVNYAGYWPGVSEAAAGKYMGRLFMDYFNAGIVKTFAYELVEQYPDPNDTSREWHFGLLRNDFSYKPSAVVIKNLIHLLQEPGANFTPSSLDYTIAGGNSSLQHLLLQKSDGTFYLALWQDVASYDASVIPGHDIAVAPLSVTLNINGVVGAITEYLPTQSMTPVATFGTGALNLQVPDEVMLLQITVPEPSGLAALGMLLLALGRRRRA